MKRQKARQIEVTISIQGTLREVVKNTWARGGVLGFFSGNEAGQ